MRSALLSKRFHFEAAHHLPGHNGKCARPHGHSYVLEVTVRGPIRDAPGAPYHGMVMDFSEVTEIVRPILARLDHQDLNRVTDIQTTAENLAWFIWDALLVAGIPAARLHRIRLWETQTSYVEITAKETTSAPLDGA